MKDEEEDVPEKNQIYREYMARVSEHMAEEEEALKATRVIRGVDTKQYHDNKKFKNVSSPKQRMSDKAKLKVMRLYQLLIGFMGFIGVAIIFLSIEEPIVYLSIKDSVIEIDLILLGCALASAGVVGIIGFQHRHDKISDRIHGKHRAGIRTKRKRA